MRESGPRFMANEAGNLVKALPASLVDLLVSSLEQANVADWSSANARILGGFSNPHYRGLVADFLLSWHARAANLSAEAVVLALLSAGSSEKGYREGQSFELV